MENFLAWEREQRMAFMSCVSTSSNVWQSQLKRIVFEEKPLRVESVGSVRLRVAVAGPCAGESLEKIESEFS